MNENAKKWVAALRSGEYRQATGEMRKGNSFCCLGVLCDLHAKATGGEWHFGGKVAGTRYLDKESVLPKQVMEWAGVRSECGDCKEDGVNDSSLTGMNDNGATFAEIADIIESEPDGLFADWIQVACLEQGDKS